MTGRLLCLLGRHRLRVTTYSLRQPHGAPLCDWFLTVCTRSGCSFVYSPHGKGWV